MTGNPWRYIGVDWDSGAWVAVGYSDTGRAEPAVFDTIEDLWREHGTPAERIVVDVPIGLCESHDAADGCVETDGERSRRCDDLARTVLGPRSSSVFTAPCRDAATAAADGAEYSDVNETNKDRTGKGLMRQAANIAPGIVEVEELLLDHGASTTLVEGHPEVCFRALADDVLQYNKKTAPGMDERLSALEHNPEYEQGTWRRLAETLRENGHETGADDLLDALSLALTARAPQEEFQQLPPDPPTDAADLPMQMVYRRPEPFGINGDRG
jgi:predicted RNase H-like nuclease